MKNQPIDILSDKLTPFSNDEALSLILNNLEDTFILVDTELRIITTNEFTRHRIFENFGITIHPGMSVLTIAPPERHKDLKVLYEGVFKGDVRKSETEIIHEGRKRYFENFFKPALNTKGEIVGAIVTSRDITDTKNSAIFFREMEESWLFALEGAKQGMWDLNIPLNELHISASCKKLYGYADNEFDSCQKNWEELVHPDDVNLIRNGQKAYLTGQTPNYENTYRVRTKNGSYKWVLSRGKIISRDSEGQPIRMIGIHTDISEQIRSAEELRISNDRYHHAILATSDTVWDWDLKSNQVFWSDNFTRVFGWELPANKILDIDYCLSHIHPDDRQRVENSMQQVIFDKQKINWQEEFRYRKADDTYAYVSDRGYIIRNSQNEAIRMIGAMEDITPRKISEQILSLERLIFEMSANLDLSFGKIMEALLEGLEKIHPDAYTSVVLLKEEQWIDPMVSLRLPESFIQAIRGVNIGPSVASCGTAMYHKQTVIVEDIETDPLWAPYKELAASYGLKACWAFPIIHSTGKVMGSFAIYYRQKRSPGYDELNTLERIRNIIRVLMEHNWSLNEIRVAHERFDIMMQATHDLIWDWDLEKNIIYRNEIGLKKVFGMGSNDSIKGIYQWLGRIHPDDQAEAEDMINEISSSRDQDTFELEYRFRRDDGTYSHVYDRGMIIRNAEGNPIRIIGAAQDLTERKRLEQELLQNELERQKAINQATVDTQEQERSEIGKELHDNVNQVLTTTKLYLDLAMTNMELKDELIGKSNNNIVSVINEIRQLSRSLMDPSIGDLGLIDSLHDLIESINLTRKLQVTLNAEKKMEDLLNKNQKLTIFRIIQEALNNAIKHAKATGVTISFKSHKNHFGITIIDNGIGFEPMFVKKGAGLKNIQNRIYLINGTHSLHSAPGKGCKIIINFPLTNKH